MKQIIVILFVALTLGALVSFKSVNPVKAKVSIFNPRVIYVGPAGNFSTIQAAIDYANASDTILVANGTYKEHVTVNKSLRLIGQNRSDTIIDANGNDYAVKIVSSNVTLSGFTIQNQSVADPTQGPGGIWINGFTNTVSNVTIANCTVAKSLFAVWFSITSDNVFRGNDFTNNSYDFGFTGEIPRYFVQDMDVSNKVDGKPVYWLVKQNGLAVPSDAGMVVAVNCTNIAVKNSAFSRNGRSVLFVSTNDSVVENVNVADSMFGIYLLYSNNNTVSNNVVFNSSLEYGITLTHSINNTVYNNTVSRCGYDLKLVTSHQNKIIANTLTNSTDIYGLMLDAGSLYNFVSGNIVRFNKWAGIALDDQSKWNVFTRNLIEFNEGTGGLELSDGSKDNLITENTFNQNSKGIAITWSDNHLSSESTVYKNNFLNNSVQVFNASGLQYNYHGTWDNGAEGNYWSNFVGVDTNIDGISDSSYNIDAYKIDRYPLMEPWSRNRTYTVVAGDKTFFVNIVSNSTIGGFNFNQTLKHIAFNVTGPAGAKGFCNVTIPKLLLNASNPAEWIVTVDGNFAFPFIDQNATSYTFFYLAYDFSTHHIQIKGTNAYPEFPVQAIFLLVVFFASFSVAVLRRKVH
jgi:parallel beta-helix repeat protein